MGGWLLLPLLLLVKPFSGLATDPTLESKAANNINKGWDECPGRWSREEKKMACLDKGAAFDGL